MKVENKDVLHAWLIDGSGKGKELPIDEFRESDLDSRFKWIHLDVSDKSCRGFLESIEQLNETMVNALLAEETRPRLEDSGSGHLVILRGINHNDPEEPEDMVSVRLWISDNLVISAQRRNLMSIRDIDEFLRNGNVLKTPGDLLALLISKLTDRMEPVLSQLDDRMDDVEEAVNVNPSLRDHQELTTIRRESILYRRFISPQKEVVFRLIQVDPSWISRRHKQEFQQVADHLIRFIENLDTIRERAQIIKDELTNALSYRMNKNLYILSIVSVIFLPLGFLTGLFGINVGGMPGADNGTAFYLFCAFLLVIVIGQLYIFKRLKLF